MSLLGVVFEDRGTQNCDGPREEEGRDQYPLGILGRVVELDKVGDLERVRRRSTLHRPHSFSAKSLEKKVLGFFSGKSEKPLLYV
jgi:hypothetical protein